MQESTEIKIFKHLQSISDKQEAEKRAEELIRIIEDERNTEADILSMLEKMEK